MGNQGSEIKETGSKRKPIANRVLPTAVTQLVQWPTVGDFSEVATRAGSGEPADSWADWPQKKSVPRARRFTPPDRWFSITPRTLPVPLKPHNHLRQSFSQVSFPLNARLSGEPPLDENLAGAERNRQTNRPLPAYSRVVTFHRLVSPSSYVDRYQRTDYPEHGC